MKPASLLSIILIILCSCEDRERLNPLDPKNSITEGAPTGLKIFTRVDSIALRWNPFNIDNMVEYQIYRGAGRDELFKHASVPADSVVFRETELDFEESYFYAVQALTEFSQSSISKTVTTMPGPHTLWVADMYNFFLRNISFDGSWGQKIMEFISPRSLALDSKTKILWLGEYFEKSLLGLDQQMAIVNRIDLPDSPIDFALDSLNRRLFVLLEDSSLRSYNMDGSIIWNYQLGFNPNLSSELVYDVITGSIWLSSNVINAVLKIAAADPEAGADIFSLIPNPGPLEADPVNGGVWVSTETGIVRIKASGEMNWYKQELFIHDISIHPQSGDCYYTGSRERFSNWETGYLTYSNPEVHQIILDNDVDQLYNIQVMPGINSTGIFAQQAFTWKLLRFTEKGEKVGELDNFNSRLDFALD
ncbi:MAG: hypothetical protein V3S48_06425 [Candidatus Neomarinimicrobiota bacterium]